MQQLQKFSTLTNLFYNTSRERPFHQWEEPASLSHRHSASSSWCNALWSFSKSRHCSLPKMLLGFKQCFWICRQFPLWVLRFVRNRIKPSSWYFTKGAHHQNDWYGAVGVHKAEQNMHQCFWKKAANRKICIVNASHDFNKYVCGERELYTTALCSENVNVVRWSVNLALLAF